MRGICFVEPCLVALKESIGTGKFTEGKKKRGVWLGERHISDIDGAGYH